LENAADLDPFCWPHEVTWVPAAILVFGRGSAFVAEECIREGLNNF